MIELIFDLETKKFFDEVDGERDAGLLGVSVVSAYRRELDENLNEKYGEMKSFWEKDFEEMWKWFDEAERIVGYNSLGFDVPALVPYYPKGDLIKKLPHFDVLAKIREVFGKRVKLDSVAKEVLGVGKIADGGDAVRWWSLGDEESLANLKKYCEMDVEVTKGVYDYGLRNGKLKFKDHWNELREILVDFSHPKREDKKEELQMGLF